MTPRKDGQEASMQYRKIIMNLFDGDGAGDGSADGQSGSGGESTKTALSQRTVARGRELGLDDDLLEDYQKAFGGDSDGGTENKTTDETKQEAETEEDLDKEFRELTEGKYKDSYKRQMSSAIKNRLTNSNRENKELRHQLEKSDRILKMLEGKYELDPNDPDALYKAVKEDSDIWRDRAIQTGGSIEEAVNAFEDAQRQDSEHRELEEYRRQERVRALDAKFEELAAQTAEKYPDFDLKAEFENPKFRQALDVIAQSNAQRNEQSGRNDEIYDLTYAYELAHADELRDNVIKRSSKATASAYAQTIAANRNRIKENATHGSGQTETKVDIMNMSDEDFDRMVRDIKSGKRKIPG